MDLVFTAYWESAPDTPLVAPANIPTIRIRRLDTDALVVTDAAMDEVGDGNFKYVYSTPVEGVRFAARADGDPTAAGQVPTGSRYQSGSGDNFAGEVYQNEGLDPNNPKTITENVAGSDYDENVDQIQKDVTKVGNVTTLTRT